MKAVNDLPPELLIHIFKNLPRRDWRSIEQVCQRWRKLIMVHFWRQHIQLLAKNDGKLPILLQELGWTQDCDVIFEEVLHNTVILLDESIHSISNIRIELL